MTCLSTVLFSALPKLMAKLCTLVSGTAGLCVSAAGAAKRGGEDTPSLSPTPGRGVLEPRREHSFSGYLCNSR